MITDTGLKYQRAMDDIAREVIETVTDRHGDSPAKRVARQQATAWSISSFLPRDPIETMLAGHCVIYDHLLRDGARDTLGGQDPNTKLRARPQVLATGKMFLAHLEKLEQLQTRLAGEPVARAPGETAAATTAGADAPRKATAPADATQQPVPGDPSGNVRVPAKGELSTPEVTPPGVNNAQEAVARVGEPPAMPRASNVGNAAAQAGPTAMPRPEQTRHAAAQPAVRPAPAAQATIPSTQGAGAGPNGDAARTHPSLPPAPLNPRPQQPSSAEAERAQTVSRGNQALEASRHAEALAMLAASTGVNSSPELADRTPSTGQRHPTAPAASVAELV